MILDIEIWQILRWILESLISQILFALFSFATFQAFCEWRLTTKLLRKYVAQYIESVAFEWTNETTEFIITYRVRAFEILLRNLQSMQPRTGCARKRVEEVQDVLENFHNCKVILNRKVLPLPDPNKFPFDIYQNGHIHKEIEPTIRNETLKKLQAIKWLKIRSIPLAYSVTRNSPSR